VIETLGIHQARIWGVCTMNEFRGFLGLKKFATFEEWNPDPAIAGAARKLYNHIDNLELYAGLQAEDCMPLGPGSGICCGCVALRWAGWSWAELSVVFGMQIHDDAGDPGRRDLTRPRRPVLHDGLHT